MQEKKCRNVSETSSRESDTRFSSLGFFHESVSPRPLSILLGPLRIFTKIRGDIRNFVCLPVSTTPAINYRWCRCYRGHIIAGVVDIGDLPLLPSISANFCKNSKRNSQVKYGVRSPKFIWAPCAQLYSLAETPQPPPTPAFGLIYEGASSPPRYRRHLFVTPCPISILRGPEETDL